MTLKFYLCPWFKVKYVLNINHVVLPSYQVWSWLNCFQVMWKTSFHRNGFIIKFYPTTLKWMKTLSKNICLGLRNLWIVYVVVDLPQDLFQESKLLSQALLAFNKTTKKKKKKGPTENKIIETKWIQNSILTKQKTKMSRCFVLRHAL